MSRPAKLRVKSRLYLAAADEESDLDQRKSLASHAFALAQQAEKIEREERTEQAAVGVVSKESKALAQSRMIAAVKSDAVFAEMDKRASENFFADRGFTARTIHALVASGVHLPEEILLITEDEAGRISGLDCAGRAEVQAYRTRFLSTRA